MQPLSHTFLIGALLEPHLLSSSTNTSSSCLSPAFHNTPQCCFTCFPLLLSLQLLRVNCMLKVYSSPTVFIHKTYTLFLNVFCPTLMQKQANTIPHSSCGIMVNSQIMCHFCFLWHDIHSLKNKATKSIKDAPIFNFLELHLSDFLPTLILSLRTESPHLKNLKSLQDCTHFIRLNVPSTIQKLLMFVVFFHF